MTTLSNSTAATLGFTTLEEYAPLIGSEAADRIVSKGKRVSASHIVHISSTFYGGGVSELLTPLTLMMNALGIETGWRMVQGTPAFFTVTKKMHNALQGERIELSPADKEIYEQIVFENSLRLHIDDCDAVIVHDPQPLSLIEHFPERDVPWFWQCHVDVSEPHLPAWNYLRQFAEKYDANVFTLPEYGKPLATQQRFVKPAINPFSPKNRALSDEEIVDSLSRYRMPTDRPLGVQISRFDRWKDPMGVIEAFRQARKEVDCTLVLLGNNAVDDPEGDVILETILASPDDRMIVLNADDPILV